MEAILALALALLLGTSSTQKQVNSDNIVKQKEIYSPSEALLSDVIHTNLALIFNWEKQLTDLEETIQSILKEKK